MRSRIERARKILSQPPRTRDGLGENAAQKLGLHRSLEQPSADQHLPQDDSDRVDIDALVFDQALFDRAGHEIRSARVIGFQTAATFGGVLDQVLAQ